ncbi:MAG: hypothetical protein HOV81_39580, partial [Kofleriaceae bacterium]|nr:hypothetical protein [Kofleriaceae bacterium]
ARDAEAQTREAQGRAAEADARARDIEARAREIETRARDIEARAKEAAERIVDAERRAREAETKLTDALDKLDDLEGTSDGSSADVSALQARIDELEAEVEKADNVRQFAANTEREIAGLERELRDMKAKVTQITLERDRFESQLRDLREDDETTNRRAPSRDPEATAQADLSRYTALVARAAELEQKVLRLEKDDEQHRRELSEANARLAAQHRAQEDEPTNTGNSLPIEFAEHLSVLEESIDSLRANMRAASDETAMMDQTESVMIVSSAVSQAAEHVERARDSLRALTAVVGKA